ncbi:hypothetical protein L6164_009984 [Bauhinia variegata]|uniref:Uncharacterized protein n=1 Tax=Bauhinia variegata TaxID=167791 RepID=A0ACB9PKV1_BAUVA|nr:hypothetical protein L6164_009984 [Bauhinia variegata]
MYVTRGQGRVQVVNNQGRSVFNGVVRRGQLLVVPQNFVVAQEAGNQGLEFIAFKTNDNALISPMSGTTSVMRGIPAEVLANAFGFATRQVNALKYCLNEGVLVSPRPRQSPRYIFYIEFWLYGLSA